MLLAPILGPGMSILQKLTGFKGVRYISTIQQVSFCVEKEVKSCNRISGRLESISMLI